MKRLVIFILVLAAFGSSTLSAQAAADKNSSEVAKPSKKDSKKEEKKEELMIQSPHVIEFLCCFVIG